MTLEEAIRATLEHWNGLPLIWGESDCVLATADVYVLAGYPDPVAGYRGRYTTRRGALRIMGRADGLPERIERLGWLEVLPSDAQTGDLGVMSTPEGPACIIQYQGFWLGRTDGGYAAYGAATTAFRAWRPPCLKQ
jgi:hypothetical protein